MRTGDQRAVIILVEEERDQRQAITGLLAQAGFSVAAAGTTDEALHLLEVTPDAAGLVTCAHVPGGIDGWELAQRARARKPGLAVILMSGHSDPSSGPLPEGAAFVLKPNVPARLGATLREMIGEA